MAKNKLKSNQIDWSSMALNIKSAKNTSGTTPTVGTNFNLASVGAQVTFTVETACAAFVTVQVASRSTSDYELKPQIFLDGVIYSNADAGASVSGTAANRAVQRAHSDAVSLSAGTHTISAGIFLGSSTSATVAAGEANITAIVLGRVTA